MRLIPAMLVQEGDVLDGFPANPMVKGRVLSVLRNAPGSVSLLVMHGGGGKATYTLALAQELWLEEE